MQFLFVLFMAIVAILLVNMLIAMMGNTYQKIAETKNEWQRQVSLKLDFIKTKKMLILNAVGSHRAGSGERSAAGGAAEKTDGLFAAHGRRAARAGPPTKSIGLHFLCWWPKIDFDDF